MIIKVTKTIVNNTIEQLKLVGNKKHECMIFWLGERSEQAIIVKKMFVPIQKATMMSLQIPPIGMKALFNELRIQRYMIAAQVHSHPYEAFHSEADDCLALPRHEGAISIVLPHFCRYTTLSSFLNDAVCYVLSKNDIWKEMAINEVIIIGH